MADLVREYELCSIPARVNNLVINLRIRDDDANEYGLSDDLDEILGHFAEVTETLSLDIPWLISRSAVPDTLLHRNTLRRFVLSGTYCWFEGLCDAISDMQSLESLVIIPTWTPGAWEIFRPTDSFAPVGLKEICLSPSSLVLMQWFTAPTVKLPNLHVLRLKIDDGLENQRAFLHSAQFFERFGSTLRHLFVWFEGFQHNQRWLWKGRYIIFLSLVDIEGADTAT